MRYYGFLAHIVAKSHPASNLIARQSLGWEPTQPGLLTGLGNGRYSPAET